MVDIKHFCDVCKKEYKTDWPTHSGVMDTISKCGTILFDIVNRRYKDICPACDEKIKLHTKTFQDIFDCMVDDVNNKIKEVCTK